jgi:hypothetical protein
MRRGFLTLLTLLLAFAVCGEAQAGSAFSGWGAVVVAGDWHAHSGGPSEAFDNARRDVAAELAKLGFSPTNIRQFSVRPERYADTHPAQTDLDGVSAGLKAVSAAGPSGCLVYFSTHGSPAGIAFNGGILTPDQMAAMVDDACPGKPTIVVISACFSGVFLPALAENNRMILTAARPDRASFGCGESDKYPYFDDCFLRMAPKAANFQALGAAVQQCVADRELETGAAPPSEPQLWIGPALLPMLPLYTFPRS